MNKLSVPFQGRTDPNLDCFTHTGKFPYHTLHMSYLIHPEKCLTRAIDLCGAETPGLNRYDSSMIGSSSRSALPKLKKMP